MTRSAHDPLAGLPERFELLEEIDRREVRSVLRLRDRHTGLDEVWKIAHPEAEEETRGVLREEFLLLERIRHPHWVRAIGFLHLEGGAIGYRMEALDPAGGVGTMEGWNPRDLSAARAILGALETLHALDYAHLDLKPAQILSGAHGPCLIDPGMAALTGSPVSPRGTWGFVAPEILAGGAWDARADLYGFGCLLHWTWTGSLPSEGGSVDDQARRLSSRPRLRLRERSVEFQDGLDRVLAGLLDPDPERRPAGARAAWDSLHALAGFRPGYEESRGLPCPESLPFVPDRDLEARWDAAVRGEGPRRWIVAGAPGSGRRRLLRRLAARAEAFGATWDGSGDDLRVRPRRGGRGAEIVCRIGAPESGAEVVALGPIGVSGARAALRAWGLEPEGGEEVWLPGLLRLRLDERRGGVAEQRAARRRRRALAAAWELDREERGRLAEVLVAATDGTVSRCAADGRLVREGWLRADPGETVAPGDPPWDRESLAVAAGADALRAAHGRALGREAAGDRAAACRHALAIGDARQTERHLIAGVAHHRERGDARAALALLRGARQLLGATFRPAWTAILAELALEQGDPSEALPLLSGSPPDVDANWRTLLDAHVLSRGGDPVGAEERLRGLLAQAGIPPPVRAWAEAGLLGALLMQGRLEETAAEGWKALLDPETGPSGPAQAFASRAIFDALSERGAGEEELQPARAACERLLPAAGSRGRMLLHASLGADAFRAGRMGEAAEHLEAAVAASRDAGDRVQVGFAEMNLAGVYFEMGRLSDAEAMNRAALKLGRQLFDPVLASHARLNLATVLHSSGRWSAALTLSREARAGFELAGMADVADAACLVEETVLLDTGLLRAAGEVGRELEERLAARPQPILESVHGRNQGRLRRTSGGIEEARPVWERATRVAEENRVADESARTLLEWATAEAAAGRGEEARRLVDRAAGASHESAGVDLRIRRCFALAILDWQSDPRAAGPVLQALQVAAAEAAGGDLLPWSWRLHAAAARVHQSAGQPREALRALRRAEATLRELLVAIGDEAIQESYAALPEPAWFLAWIETGNPPERTRLGRFDLEGIAP